MEAPFQSGVNQALPARVQNLWDADGNRSAPLLAASLICANPLNIETDLRQLEEGKIDLLHFDVMDGNFVPRLGIYPEVLKAVRQATQIPIDVHLMLADAERYIPLFADAGADIIVVHAEATAHLPRQLSLIQRCGARPGVAFNPATVPQTLTYILDEIEFILLMTFNPGVVGQKASPAAMQKIGDVYQFLGEKANMIHIIIDGNVTQTNAADMVKRGASILVCGSSSIFDQKKNIRDSIHAFREGLNKDLSNRGEV